MITYHEKIPCFCCSYFQPYVCEPLFGLGRLVLKVHRFVADISELGMCCEVNNFSDR